MISDDTMCYFDMYSNTAGKRWLIFRRMSIWTSML